jgi:hypothetical protein
VIRLQLQCMHHAPLFGSILLYCPKYSHCIPFQFHPAVQQSQTAPAFLRYHTNTIFSS